MKKIKGLSAGIRVLFTILPEEPHPHPLPTEGEGRRLRWAVRIAVGRLRGVAGC